MCLQKDRTFMEYLVMQPNSSAMIPKGAETSEDVRGVTGPKRAVLFSFLEICPIACLILSTQAQPAT